MGVFFLDKGCPLGITATMSSFSYGKVSNAPYWGMLARTKPISVMLFKTLVTTKSPNNLWIKQIEKAFSNGKAFIVFVTSGDPDLETTQEIVYALDKAGCSLVKLGIPFSDPTAEGPVI